MTLKTKEIIDYLERTRAVRTLLCLLGGKERGLDEILRQIGGSKSTGMARISELMKLGLVEKKVSQKEKRKMFYHLTTKGKKIAEKLETLLESIEQ